MLRIDKVIKSWKDSAALNDHINLYGQWSETAFLSKSGDLGMVLRVVGVDYESLDHSNQEYAVKRLEAALKLFGPGFHVYQYLFKSNRPEIPFADYDDLVVQTEVNHRREFFHAKRDSLYQIDIYYCVLLRSAQTKTGIGPALSRLAENPLGAFQELKARFSSGGMQTLLRSQIESDRALLEQRVETFVRQLSDLVPIEVLNERGQLRFFRRLLNYDDWRIAGNPKSTQFLDFKFRIPT
jgi:type IV secretory pathway VirB4 component